MAPDDALVVRFYGDVDEAGVTSLLDLAQEALEAGQRLVVLLSTVGGSVFHALSAHNYLAGLPLEVEMHNFGSVDSAGALLYCAGQRRYAVPEARFVLHAPSFNFEDESLGEGELAERLGKLRVDGRNMAGVLARVLGRGPDDVLRDLRTRVVLDVEQALAWGLAHEVRRALVPPGARVRRLARGRSEEPWAVAGRLLDAAKQELREEILVQARGPRQDEGLPRPARR